MSIAETLKYERLKRGMTQEQFAEIIHVTRSELCHYEHGRVPKPARIKNIGEQLGTDLAKAAIFNSKEGE